MCLPKTRRIFPKILHKKEKPSVKIAGGFPCPFVNYMSKSTWNVPDSAVI